MALVFTTMAFLVLFCEQDWTERDEDNNLEIERMLILVRNVLQVPADLAEEQRADNDASIHDQVREYFYYFEF